MISISSLLSPLDNISHTTFVYTRLLKVPVTRSSIVKEITTHPDFPSMLSISDILSEYGIENYAIKLNPLQFKDLDSPFITQIKLADGEEYFTVVKSVEGNKVNYLDPVLNNWTSLSLENFLIICTRVILFGEGSLKSGEENYNVKRKGETRKHLSAQVVFYSPPILLLILSAYTWFEYGVNFILPILFTFLSLIGTYVTSLLLVYEVDKHNPMLQQVCSGSKRVNCESVLHSKAGSVLGVRLSIIGFSYFAGSLFSMWISGLVSQNVIIILSWFSVVSIPFILFSLYYQWKVVKQWCVLCLWVQVTLSIQAIIVLFNGWLHVPFQLDSIVQTSLLIPTSFILFFILSKFLISVLTKAKESKENEMKLTRFKNNPEVFSALLARQKEIIVNSNGLGLVIGNPDAKHKIIKVCNPYCGPCASAHPLIEEMIRNNPDVQVQIIFTSTDDEKDTKAKPVRHLLAIAEKENDSIRRALDDWYNAPKKEYKVFADKYPMNDELKNQEPKLIAMRNWCDQVEIKFTPTFFVNGYQIPETYSLRDLSRFFRM